MTPKKKPRKARYFFLCEECHMFFREGELVCQCNTPSIGTIFNYDFIVTKEVLPRHPMKVRRKA